VSVVDEVYARTVAAVPDLALVLGTGTLPGSVLADPEWLRARIADGRRSWRVDDPRVVGTLWWYMASSTLVGPPVATLLATGIAVDPALDAVLVGLRPDGYLGGARSGRVLGGDLTELGSALRDAFTPVIEELARASGAGERSLWAIAADSFGGWALRAGAALNATDRATGVAVAVARAIGPVMPVPRFVDVGERRFVRRSSCCLIYVVPGCDKCTSCPRQTPDERLRRLAAAE
jgi:ferric iron reductase protein FhuF